VPFASSQARITGDRFIGSLFSACCNGRMKPDPDQMRWDGIARRITLIRWVAVTILALLLGASVLLLR
jgi:hypothetical protein